MKRSLYPNKSRKSVEVSYEAIFLLTLTLTALIVGLLFIQQESIYYF